MHIQLGNTIELKPVNNIEVTLLFSGTVTQNDNPIPAPLTSEVYANNELISARHFTSSADGAFNIVQTLPKEQLAEELELAVSMVAAPVGEACRVTKTISDLVTDQMIDTGIKSGDESKGNLLDAGAETLKKEVDAEIAEKTAKQEPETETVGDVGKEVATAEAAGESAFETQPEDKTPVEEAPKDKAACMALIESGTDLNQPTMTSKQRLT